MLNQLKTLAFGDERRIGPIASSSDLDSSRRPRVLIIRAGAIGDTLMATPLVRAVRRTFPDSHIVFVCSLAARETMMHNPHVDQVIALAYRHLPAWLSPEKRVLVRSLRQLHPDWAVVLESHRSFIDLAALALPTRLIAYGKVSAPGTVIENALFDPDMHSIDNHLRVGEKLLGVQSAGREMELHYPPSLKGVLEARLAAAGVGKGEMLAGIHAGWGGRAQAPEETRLRSWPPERFAEVARWLSQTVGARVVLTGSVHDRPLTEFISRHAQVPCLDLSGMLSVLELAALIDRLAVYVTVDSGPAHMAAALGTPLVTLFGPGIFQQTRPLTERGTIRVIRHHVPCAPCYGTALLKRCTDNICMKAINVSEVKEAINTALIQAIRK